MSVSSDMAIVENMTLDKVKSLFSEDARSKIESFFRELLSCIEKPSDSRIITILNDLCKQYNYFYNDDLDTSTREKAKEYHKCLFELFNWSVPFLNTYHKLVLYTNLCILSDDDSDSMFHNEHFNVCLNNATTFVLEYGHDNICKDAKSESEDQRRILCYALYCLGFLNFREHQYPNAKACFALCFDVLIDFFTAHGIASFTEPWAKELYFNCTVRFANCCEYQDETWEAIDIMLGLSGDEHTDKQVKWIEYIGSQASSIHDGILKYYQMPRTEVSFDQNKNAKKNTFPIVKAICNHLLASSTSPKPSIVFQLDDLQKPLSSTVKLYVHVLAHCLSEYAAKLRRQELEVQPTLIFPACSTLQLVSRFLLDWLVSSCGEESLVSCQATIRAENDACPEAIGLLLQRYFSLEKQKNQYTQGSPERDSCERELTEVSFYLFYFSEQELRANYKDEKLENIFKKYGDSFKLNAEESSANGDYDALFHYYVIRVKYLLKRKAESLLRVNEITDYSDLDYEFAQMCTYKEKCSEHIFSGLIEEYDRLVKLYSFFQKLRWLTEDTYQPDIINELEFLQACYGRKIGLVCGSEEGEGAYDEKEKYNKLVHTVYNGIQERKKILILAPVKDAPSCAPEFEDIKRMLEFIPSQSSNVERDNLVPGSLQKESESRDGEEIKLKQLNTSQDYFHLKFAIFVDTTGSHGSRFSVGITYLYSKCDSVVQNEYRESIPLIMEEIESNKLIQLIKKIKEQLKSGQLVKNQQKCPREQHDDSYGAQCCTYYVPYSSAENELLKSISELLVFLEFDFHASSLYPISEHGVILISNPNKPPHQFFSILVFDSDVLKVEGGKGLCSLSENFCTYVEQYDALPKTAHTEGESTPQTVGKAKDFCRSYLYNADEEIKHCLERLNDIVQDDPKKTLPNTKCAEGFRTKIERSCYKGTCECLEENCYVREAKMQFNMG